MTRAVGAVLALCLILVILAACAAAPAPASDGRLRIVATTTIVGDVVSRVGGDKVDLTVLLPVGADPHSFDPSPQDVARLAEARLIFVNGFGLEAFVERMIQNAGDAGREVTVSQGITPLAGLAEPDQPTAAPGQAVDDPHVWLDPTNVITWTNNIAAALSAADPSNAATYQANAQAYTQQLTDLEAWIGQQVSQIPPARRLLVTDHAVFGYFARRYGFTQVGTVVPGYSTVAQPSAQELARLEDTIRSAGVPAILVGKTVNPTLEEQVAQDTGTRLVYVYTGSLSAPDGDAATYLDYMHYDVSAIVDALK